MELSQKKSFQNQMNLFFYQLNCETLLLMTKMVIIYELEYDRIGQIYTVFWGFESSVARCGCLIFM